MTTKSKLSGKDVVQNKDLMAKLHEVKVQSQLNSKTIDTLIATTTEWDKIVLLRISRVLTQRTAIILKENNYVESREGVDLSRGYIKS